MPVNLTLRRQRLKVILGYAAKFYASLNACDLSKTKQNENVKSWSINGEVWLVTLCPPAPQYSGVA